VKPTTLIVPLALLLAALLALLIIWALLARAKARQRQQRVRRASQPFPIEAGHGNDKESGVGEALACQHGVDVCQAEAEGGFGVELERVWARGGRARECW
jgi:hypothetical protein